MYKGHTQIVAGHFQFNRIRSQIVASLNFEAMILILVSTAELGSRLLVLLKDFLMAEFEFVQVKRIFYDH